MGLTAMDSLVGPVGGTYGVNCHGQVKPGWPNRKDQRGWLPQTGTAWLA